jgi:hypothetical protein
VQRVLRHDPRVRARFERDKTGLQDTSDSGIDMSLAALLAYRRLEGSGTGGFGQPTGMRPSRVSAAHAAADGIAGTLAAAMRGNPDAEVIPLSPGAR